MTESLRHRHRHRRRQGRRIYPGLVDWRWWPHWGAWWRLPARRQRWVKRWLDVGQERVIRYLDEARTAVARMGGGD
jgi:hypothetical protein